MKCTGLPLYFHTRTKAAYGLSGSIGCPTRDHSSDTELGSLNHLHDPDELVNAQVSGTGTKHREAYVVAKGHYWVNFRRGSAQDATLEEEVRPIPSTGILKKAVVELVAPMTVALPKKKKNRNVHIRKNTTPTLDISNFKLTRRSPINHLSVPSQAAAHFKEIVVWSIQWLCALMTMFMTISQYQFKKDVVVAKYIAVVIGGSNEYEG